MILPPLLDWLWKPVLPASVVPQANGFHQKCKFLHAGAACSMDAAWQYELLTIDPGQ